MLSTWWWLHDSNASRAQCFCTLWLLPLATRFARFACSVLLRPLATLCYTVRTLRVLTVRAPDPVLARFLFSAREPYMQTLCRER